MTQIIWGRIQFDLSTTGDNKSLLVKVNAKMNLLSLYMYLLNKPPVEAPTTNFVIAYFITSSATADATSSDSITTTSTCTYFNNSIRMHFI